MNIKTYTAAKMSDALALVKRQFGPDAVILHTRSYKRGGVLGIGAHMVVEVTAANGAEVGQARRTRQLTHATATLPATDKDKVATAQPTAGDLIRRTYAAAQQQLEHQQAVMSVARSPSQPDSQSPSQLAEEMRAVRRMVSRMMCQQEKRALGPGLAPDMPDELVEHYLGLLEQDVSQELAQQVINQVTTQMQESDPQDDTALGRALLESLAGLIPADKESQIIEATEDGRPRTIALIGPTGVGKTTTIAKLAANFKLKQKLNVSLVTLDTYRIAAVDQLNTYADIIGVPLYVVARPEQMSDAMQSCAGSDVVMIDTAGRSQHDDPKLDQLDGLIRSARPHETHLVLSSTCTQNVLLDTVERFSRIPTDRIIFTKLDEAVTFGVILNVVRKVNKRLSFVTTGQEVPHHIESGQSGRLAALLLGHDKLIKQDALPVLAGQTGKGV